MTLSACSLLLLLLALVSRGEAAGHWSYDRQQEWPPACRDGKRQSPIDLPDACGKDSKVQKKENLRLTPRHYDKELPVKRTKLENNGHTFELSVTGFDKVDATAPLITGSAAGDQRFQFTQLHLHWSGGSEQGAEHTLAGRRPAMEVHLVHFNVKYKTIKDATAKPDGLLVVGVFLTPAPSDNPSLAPIIEAVSKTHKKGAKADLTKGVKLKDLLPPSFASRFYSYNGSLTTPPCSQSVTWIVAADKKTLGKQQLSEFQKTKGNFYRHTQKLNGRQIEFAGKCPGAG